MALPSHRWPPARVNGIAVPLRSGPPASWTLAAGRKAVLHTNRNTTMAKDTLKSGRYMTLDEILPTIPPERRQRSCQLVPLIFDFFKKSLVIWGTVDLNGALSEPLQPSRGSRRLFSST